MDDQGQATFSLGKADSRTFSGDAMTGLLGAAAETEAVKLYLVRFAPAARTFWHIHSGSQILVVTEGRCRYQREGGPVEEIGEGRSVRFEPGERHWHGAAADQGCSHIAINLASGSTEWQEEAHV